MTTGAAWALQMALYDHLGSDQGLRAAIGDPPRIHDRPPEDAVFPLLQIGEGRMEPYGGIDGAFEHVARLTVWSRWGGRKECKAIAALVRDALQDSRMPVAGHRVVQARLLFEDHLRYRDPDTYQGVLRYRFVTVPELAAAA